MKNVLKDALKNVKHKFKSQPLNFQINIAIGIIILVTIFLITGFTYIRTLNQIKQNFRDTGLLIVQETVDKINSRLKLIENTAMMISSDSRIVNYSNASQHVDDAEITKYLNNCYNFNKYDTHQEGLAFVQNLIDDIIFVTDNNIIITRRLHFTSYNIRSQLGNEWFRKAYSNKGKLVWTDCFYNTTSQQLLGNSSDEVSTRNNFMLIQYLQNEKTLTDIGYIALSVNLENLSKLIDNIQFGKDGNLYIVNKAGIILAGEDRTELLKRINFDSASMQKVTGSSQANSFFEGTIAQKKYFIYHAPISINNWKLVLTIPVKEMEDSVSSTLFSVIIIGILSFIVVTTISSLILNNMSHPLKNILQSIKATRSGNLSHKVDVQGCMEVNELSTEFNFMLDKISSLLERIVDEQKSLRKSELKALRAQINPHFLYNTLDSIKWLIYSGSNEKASELIAALSTFFRIGLSGGSEEILIRDEVEHVKHYLFIQKLRCGDKMNYLIDMDPEVENLKTLKLILQPVIENAILHGLNQKDSEGFIKLIVKKQDPVTVVFEITDNGIGMTPEELEKLNAKISDPLIHSTAGSHGYAMRNVNQRIKLSYGDEYGITYKSKHGIGTKVIVTIPAIGNNINMQMPAQ